MATESVNDTLQAFAGYDSSIYMAWIAALSDMLMTGGDITTMHPETLPNYGGLMRTLTEAAGELQERERQEARDLHQAKAA